MNKIIRNQHKQKNSWFVIDKLQGLISSKTLKPGDKLPAERELAAEFKVSRPTVREAIQSLVGIGILTTKQGAGTFVVKANDLIVLDLNPLQLIAKFHDFSREEILQARISLEMVIAGLAAENATGEDLAGISEELAEMFSKLDSPGEYLEHNMKFHQKIAAASGNRLLTAILNMLVPILIDCIGRESSKDLNIKATTKSNQEIYRAIRNKDAVVARKLMHDHLSSCRL